MAKILTITVRILIDGDEAELFKATDEDSLIGQADMVSDFLREPTQYGELDWELNNGSKPGDRMFTLKMKNLYKEKYSHLINRG